MSKKFPKDWKMKPLGSFIKNISDGGNAVDFGGLLTISSSNRGGSAMSNNSRAVIPVGTYAVTASRGMDYVTIASIGSNALDFGELSQNRAGSAGTDDGSRGVISGGNVPPLVDTIDYIAIGTPATATDFGELVSVTYAAAAVSNGSRGVIGGGETPSISDRMDYFTIGTLGNAADFNTGSQGELSQARSHNSGLSGT